MPRSRPTALLVLLASLLPGDRPAPAQAPGKGGAGDGPAMERRPDVRYVPTPQHVVDRMLELAEIKPGDVLYDLGCGDGRIVVTAAKRYGIKAVGIDIDPARVRESRENARAHGVEALVTIRQADIFAADLTGATVVTLYLTPVLNARLKPKLAGLGPGARILSHSFAMPGARPRRIERVEDGRGTSRNIYLWVVPWDEAR